MERKERPAGCLWECRNDKDRSSWLEYKLWLNGKQISVWLPSIRSVQNFARALHD